ncbi:MAG: anti-sigma factor antagonist [Acidimicrobiaceae bacterium]|nr:anti-sigma factor antagonist [Acidimicrobiaceae bacterium]
MRPTGELDVATAPAFRQMLMDAVNQEPDCVIVDLSGVTFIDSTALGVIVGASKRARLMQVDVVLDHPSPSIRKVLEITGMDYVIAIQPDRV